MTPRRGLVGAVVACAAGALLVLLSSGRTWSQAVVREVTSAGRTHLAVTGHQVAPALSGLAIALLALAAAVLASRGVLRRIVGTAVVFAGAAVVGVAVTARGDVSAALEHREVGAQGLPVHAAANGWWVPALLGGLLALGAGVATVVRGDRWAGMGAKYDAPTAAPPREPDPAAQAWAALDRGEDPTVL